VASTEGIAVIKSNSRWGYVRDGLIGVGFGLFCLAFAAFFFWVAGVGIGDGQTPITWQMRHPLSSALTRALPPEAIQIFAVLVGVVGLIGAGMFIFAGLRCFYDLARDWREVGDVEARIRANRARHEARERKTPRAVSR
jgi:hypothetical protein